MTDPDTVGHGDGHGDPPDPPSLSPTTGTDTSHPTTQPHPAVAVANGSSIAFSDIPDDDRAAEADAAAADDDHDLMPPASPTPSTCSELGSINRLEYSTDSEWNSSPWSTVSYRKSSATPHSHQKSPTYRPTLTDAVASPTQTIPPDPMPVTAATSTADTATACMDTGDDDNTPANTNKTDTTDNNKNTNDNDAENTNTSSTFFTAHGTPIPAEHRLSGNITDHNNSVAAKATPPTTQSSYSTASDNSPKNKNKNKHDNTTSY